LPLVSKRSPEPQFTSEKERTANDHHALTKPTVKVAIEALQSGDRKGWSALFETDAKFYDDGSPRSLEEFTKDALGTRGSPPSNASKIMV